MKLLSPALRATLQEFDIKGLSLSAEANVSTGMVSNFKNGVSAITTDSLEKILSALSDEEFSYWISQVVQSRGLENLMESPVSLHLFVHQLDSSAAAEVLHALAVRLRDNDQLTKAR